MAIQKFIIARDDAVTHAWPDLTKASNDDLVCVFTECTEHLDRTNSRLCFCRSTDRGRTWTPKQGLTEFGSKMAFYNNARINNINGTLVIVCDKIIGKTGELGTDENLGETKVYAWTSNDHGKTWTGPFATPVDGICPDRLRMTKTGRVLLSAHKYNPATDKLEQYLWYTDDRGATWSDRITVAANPNYNLCEGHIVEAPDGTLIEYMRENSWAGNDCLKAISKDGGETWEGVYNVPLQGVHRPTVGYLQNGWLLMTYRYCQGGKSGDLSKKAQNTFAALLSPDEVTATDRSAQQTDIMPLDHDRNHKPDCGYTGWVQFDDGEIYVAGYIKDDAPFDHIRGYSFYCSDIRFD